MARRQEDEVDGNALRLEWRDPRTLTVFPVNPRQPGTFQRDAFNDFLDEVGWVGALLYNEQTGHILDGHMRREEAIDRNIERVPVLVVNVPEEKEREIILLYDEIGQMQKRNDHTAHRLAAMVDLKSEILQRVARGQEPAPQEEETDLFLAEPPPVPEGGISLVAGESYDYIVLLFRSTIDFVAACDHFGVQRQQCAFKSSGQGIGRVVDGTAYINAVVRRIRRTDDESPND